MANELFMYRDLVGRLSQLVNAELLRLEAIYNFDFGREFEIVLCNILFQALPDKYGVCRGHVITKNNETAGDDIIIYDQDNSPTLRMLPKGDFSRKEYIPIESVYAYIEAKHTLFLNGNGDQSIINAAHQVENVKKLERKPRPHNQITDNLTLESSFLSLSVGGLDHPDKQNPLLGCIFSRYVGWDNNKKIFSELVNIPEINLDIEPLYQPEIIVAGNDMIGLPVKQKGNISNLYLFRGTKEENLLFFKTESRAIAIGIICLMNTLESIRLNRVDWKEIIVEQLNRKK